MAKQTFTTGQVLTAAQMTSLQATAMGGGAASTKTASYVLVAADAGTTVAMNAAGATTITVNTGLFAAGDTVFIQNIGAGVCTITAGTATVNTAGALALPQYDAGILYFTSASAAIFYDYIQVGAASPLTTKGDLYTFSTSDTRLAVGANATVLTADSAEATGLKWVAPSSGALVKIAGASFTSVSTVSLDSMFSSTYLNYLATWNISDTDGNIRLRFRAGGADNTTGNYYTAYHNSGYSGAISNTAINGGTYALDLPGSGTPPRFSLTFMNPNVSSAQTQAFGQNVRGDSSAGSVFVDFGGGTAFTGFSIFTAGTTMTGDYAVYGYVK